MTAYRRVSVFCRRSNGAYGVVPAGRHYAIGADCRSQGGNYYFAFPVSGIKVVIEAKVYGRAR